MLATASPRYSLRPSLEILLPCLFRSPCEDAELLSHIDIILLLLKLLPLALHTIVRAVKPTSRPGTWAFGSPEEWTGSLVIDCLFLPDRKIFPTVRVTRGLSEVSDSRNERVPH